MAILSRGAVMCGAVMCGGRTQVAHLQPTSAAQLSDSCVVATSGAAWTLVTPAIAHALTGTQCQGFSPSQVSQFNATAFGALQSACTSQFSGGVYGACAGLTSDQVRVNSRCTAAVGGRRWARFLGWASG